MMSPTSSPSFNRFSSLAEQDVRLDMDNVSKQTQQDSAPEAMSTASGPSEELPEGAESSQPSRYSAPAGKGLAGTPLDMDANMRYQESMRPKAQVVDASANTTQNISVPSELQSKLSDLGDELPKDSAEMPNLVRPKAWDGTDDYVYMPKPKLDPWETIKQGFDKYDKEMCDAWNDELNTILTFTGLFSAAVTAFCIEAFQNLSQNPADTTNTFLMVISQQLANSSSPVANLSVVDAFTPQASDVQVNVLYFISLTLALSVSSVCILAKQWIREYQKDISVSVRDAVRIRQARFDSFETWKVPQIIGALPVILLAALMMFFSGLLIQLWNVSDQATAQVVTVIAALTILLVVATTVIPALAWIFFYAYRHLQRWFYDRAFYSPVVSSWADYDLNFLKREGRYWNGITSVHRVLKWAVEVLRNSSEIEKAFLVCLQQDYLSMERTRLGRYVLYNTTEGETTKNLDHMYYDYYELNLERSEGIESMVGRHQIELLIRSAHEAIINPRNLKRTRWDEIQYSCEHLYEQHDPDLFPRNQPDDPVVYHQHILQDQVALLLEKIFSLSPSPSIDWRRIISLLLARHSSLLSRQITLNIATIQIPNWIRKHTSVALSYAIGKAITYNLDRATDTLRTARPLFMHLDKIMVEWCSRPEGIEGLDETSVEAWRMLRLEFAECTRNLWLEEHLGIPDDYFDNLPGHGPLILAAVPSP